MATHPRLMRVQQKISELQKQWELLHERFSRLRKAVILENDPTMKFKLERQIDDTKAELQQIEQQLETLEKQAIIQSDNEVAFRPREQPFNQWQLQQERGIQSELRRKIRTFLTSLPNIEDSNSQRAFIYSAGLDQALLNQISFGGSVWQFVGMLVETLIQYGKLNDGRHALIAVLETARDYVGQDKKAYCDVLIQELRAMLSSALESSADFVEFREIPNPFIYGNPIRSEDAEVFVGRLDIVERIKKLVVTEPKPTLFLYGRRRSGKTSTLLNLHRFLGKQVNCVFLDMQDPRFRESSEAFCYNLSKMIAKRIPQLSIIWEQQDFTRDPFCAFGKFLDATEAYVIEHKITILLTLDEYERLDTRNKDILDMLRSMIQHRQKIIILVAGSHRFEDINTVSWSDYLINTQMVEISWLDAVSAHNLITRPVEDFDLDYPDGMPEKILALTHCQPYLLQAVASELVNYLNLQKRKRATDRDLELAVKTVLTSADGYFVNLWADESVAEERDLLEQIVVQGEDTVLFDPTNKILRSLLRKEILERTDNKLYFAVPLFKRWIQEKQLMLNT